MTSSIVKAVAAVLALSQPAAVIAQAEDFDPRLQPVVQQLLQEGDRNFVLNHLRLGVQAMEIGQYDVAAQSFDQALGIITSVYADSESAARARSLWIEEGSKDFRGEPYERAMAFYYRGLLDLMDGEYDTARSSFRSVAGRVRGRGTESRGFRDAAVSRRLEFVPAWRQVAGRRGIRGSARAAA